ncbi:MAG: hypothetical protein DRP09_14805 [Candidatus Thorarchaeota archaeon]|nr:MAG: hypothetical protein DRP09_14805 [Candidatus Thorarchaeota archaeon]
MIIVVGKWEKGWMEPRVEINQWLQTMKAYKVDKLIMCSIKNVRGDLEEYNDIGECLNAYEDIQKVFLEPIKNNKIISNRFIPLTEFNHPKDCMYVFGNSASGNSNYINKNDTVVYIPTLVNADLWGIVAFGIIMYDRLVKYGSNSNKKSNNFI